MKNKIFRIIRFLTFNYYPFRFKKNSLLILMFHQVNDNKSKFYSAMPIKTFEILCEFIKKHYDVIFFSDISTRINSKNKKPAAIITFDDGHRDIIENAFPILSNMRLKFNVNIDTEILETLKLQDFLKVYEILNYSQIDSYFNPKFMNEPIVINKEKPIITEMKFTEILSNLSTEKRKEFIDDMTQITNMKDHAFSKVLSPKDLKILNESALVEFGSHSHTHPTLTKVSREKLDFELSHSKEILEDIFKKKVEILAYPNGIFDETVEQAAKKAGYKYLLITNHTINLVTKKLVDEMIFDRVIQYHHSSEVALANTFGITKFLKNFLK